MANYGHWPKCAMCIGWGKNMRHQWMNKGIRRVDSTGLKKGVLWLFFHKLFKDVDVGFPPGGRHSSTGGWNSKWRGETLIYLFLLFSNQYKLPSLSKHVYNVNRSLGALRALVSSWKPFGPLDIVLRALWALRPCDPRKDEILSPTDEPTNELTNTAILGVG